MPDINLEDIRRFNEAMRSEINALDRASDGSLTDDQRENAEAVFKQLHDRRVELGQTLQERGIVDDTELEHAVSLLRSPSYREPVGLGNIVIDDEDLDYGLDD